MILGFLSLTSLTHQAGCFTPVAQICNLLYRRIVFCGASTNSSAEQAFDILPMANRRYSAARASRNQTLPLLHRMEERAGERRYLDRDTAGLPLSSLLSPLLRRGERMQHGENSSHLTKISIDTDSVQLCATGLRRGLAGPPCNIRSKLLEANDCLFGNPPGPRTRRSARAVFPERRSFTTVAASRQSAAFLRLQTKVRRSHEAPLQGPGCRKSERE